VSAAPAPGEFPGQRELGGGATGGADADIEDRLRSLQLATRVRARRGELRRSIGSLPPPAGRRELAAWLITPPDWLLSARTVETLTWPRYLGNQRARQLIRRARVSEQRRVGDLTDTERRALLALLVGETEPVMTTPGGTVTSCEVIIGCDPGSRAGDAP
jgi:hypothetical protein